MGAAVAERIKNVHWKALRNVAKDAQYLSAGLQSYKIIQDGYSGLSYIKAYRQAASTLHPSLRGSFMSHQTAHNALVNYLRTKDRPGRKSVWPGR